MKLTKSKLEVELFYKELGMFVRFRRTNLGYKSIDRFAEENGIDRTYIVRLEGGKQFGSPEHFIEVANALSISPGLMMDIFAGKVNFDGSLPLPPLSVNLPDNFTFEDKKALDEFIEFLTYRKNRAKRTLTNKQHPLTDEQTEEVLEVDQINEQPFLQPPSNTIENKTEKLDDDNQ